MSSKDPVSFEDVTCLKDTDLAILVEIDGEEYWIPQSQVHEDSEVYQEGDEGRLVVSYWFAKREGLTEN